MVFWAAPPHPGAPRSAWSRPPVQDVPVLDVLVQIVVVVWPAAHHDALGQLAQQGAQVCCELVCVHGVLLEALVQWSPRHCKAPAGSGT